jgi:aspartate racemase
MKTLGLIGGTTWVSTMDYYRLINREVNRRLGGVHSAKILMYSVDFEEFRPPVDPAEWGGLTGIFTEIALRLERAGADAIVFCANTPHLISGEVRKAIRVPLIHIGEETAKVVAASGVKKVALLGTRITMEQAFYREMLAGRGIETIVPEADDRKFIHSTILDEFAKDVFLPERKEQYLRIMDGLVNRGARGMILGCTEIPVLVKPEECPVPAFDTTAIHAAAAVEFALGE